ncbi:hypothetical protein KFZ70_17055 [Tamlana fucoidanivorans]|uniref:D-ribose pyranase n=1 Tax=Allotamlana fucoidanivorans TaxID=2583814 RepID=A0A5C4SIK3_9FLAO|nr:hypothetical protein [Tamlana fucoidanivorans]TNJ43506.1 hypothetical protein FGF67_11345 [Tamlana fucoidanivorans]
MIFILASCSGTNNNTSTNDLSWENQLKSQIQLLGHRNWIVVADAAYPLQSNPGITTILSNNDHITTIKKVNALIQQQKHIKPITFLDKELDFIPEEDAPGVALFRANIKTFLTGEIKKEVHEDIIYKLDKASELFNVIIIKTDYTIPYTSVFYQLDCKYWNNEAEKRLRTML